jgi:aspartyl/asparaginyl beta-hydroxylase (cupin superfamily)
MMSTAHLRPADHGLLKDFFSSQNDIFGKFILEQLNAYWSLVGDHSFFDTSQFPWVAELEANWTTIRSELENVLGQRADLPNLQDVSIEYSDLTTDDLWKTYILFGYGYRNERSCRMCPKTTKLVEQIPGMESALFSVLGPRKHIPAHRGLYKGLLRSHLGLIVPEPNSACRMRVDRDVRNWQEGKALVFDDSFQHEVWNDTDKYRVVLLLDFIRPLPPPISYLNDLAVERIRSWEFVTEAHHNYRRWESNLQEHR